MAASDINAVSARQCSDGARAACTQTSVVRFSDGVGRHEQVRLVDGARCVVDVSDGVVAPAVAVVDGDSSGSDGFVPDAVVLVSESKAAAAQAVLSRAIAIAGVGKERATGQQCRACRRQGAVIGFTDVAGTDR